MITNRREDENGKTVIRNRAKEKIRAAIQLRMRRCTTTGQ